MIGGGGAIKPIIHALPIVKSEVSRMTSYNGDENHRIYKIYNEKTKTNKLKFNKVMRGFHPTQKPIDLLEYLIKTYTKENEVVLDNCAGVMSTAIACINTNRKYIMIEKDRHYYDIGIKRLLEHKNKA